MDSSGFSGMQLTGSADTQGGLGDDLKTQNEEQKRF